jgi:hypothetical protein
MTLEVVLTHDPSKLKAHDLHSAALVIELPSGRVLKQLPSITVTVDPSTRTLCLSLAPTDPPTYCGLPQGHDPPHCATLVMVTRYEPRDKAAYNSVTDPRRYYRCSHCTVLHVVEYRCPYQP